MGETLSREYGPNGVTDDGLCDDVRLGLGHPLEGRSTLAGSGGRDPQIALEALILNLAIEQGTRASVRRRDNVHRHFAVFAVCQFGLQVTSKLRVRGGNGDMRGVISAAVH